jgi:hypothetical protein
MAFASCQAKVRSTLPRLAAHRSSGRAASVAPADDPRLTVVGNDFSDSTTAGAGCDHGRTSGAAVSQLGEDRRSVLSCLFCRSSSRTAFRWAGRADCLAFARALDCCDFRRLLSFMAISFDAAHRRYVGCDLWRSGQPFCIKAARWPNELMRHHRR